MFGRPGPFPCRKMLEASPSSSPGPALWALCAAGEGGRSRALFLNHAPY